MKEKEWIRKENWAKEEAKYDVDRIIWESQMDRSDWAMERRIKSNEWFGWRQLYLGKSTKLIFKVLSFGDGLYLGLSSLPFDKR